jgi:hypothetical protein
MTTCGLDELAEVLNMTVRESQERINRRHAKHVGKAIESVTVSIELNCRIRKTDRKKDKGHALLTARPLAWSKLPREGTHCLKLCASSQQEEVLVSFDGKTATDFIAEQFSPDRKQNRRRHKYLILLIGLSILGLVVALVYVIYFHP